MKTLTIRLPDSLVLEIEKESLARRVSKSDIVRERLRRRDRPAHASMKDLVGDLAGSVTGLPPNLSSKKKQYLGEVIRKKKGYRR